MFDKRLACLFPLLLIAGPPLSAKVTLREAVERALRTDPALAAQRLAEQTAAVRMAEAEGRKSLEWGLGGTLATASDSPHVRVADAPLLARLLPGDVPPGLFLISTPRTMFGLRNSFRLPLYTGGAARLLIEAEGIGATAERDLTLAREEALAAEVRASYFTVRIIEAKRESLAKLRESLERRFEKLERALEADLIRKTDALETRLQMEESGLSALDLDLALAEEKIRFAGLCGIEADEIEEPGPEEAPGMDDALDRLRSHSPILRHLEAKAAQADVLRRAAAGRDRPQAAAFAQAGFSRPSPGLFNPKPQAYILGGLSVDFSILNGRKNATQAALAEIERRRIESLRAEALGSGERELRRLYALKASVESKSAAVAGLLAAAEEDLTLKTQLYEEGQIPNLDCLAAIAQLERFRSLERELGYRRRAVVAAIKALIGAGTEDP